MSKQNITDNKKHHDKKPAKKQVHEKKPPAAKKINRKHLFIWLGVVFIVTLIALYPSVHNEFVSWDDDNYIHENQYVRDSVSSSSEVISNVFGNIIMANYHPLTISAYAIQYHFWKLDPFPYHLTNLILHLLNVLLVFWFVLKLTNNKLPVALITALLFGVHPLHVESVSWVSETKDVLYTFFFLFSLIFYLDYTKNRKDRKYYILALLFFILSCLSKGMAVTLSMILILIDYMKEKKIKRSLLMEKIPFFIVSLVFGIIAVKAQQSSEGLYNISAYSTLDKLLFPFYAVFFYIYKMFAPVNLAIIYPYPQKFGGHLPVEYYIAPLVLIILAALIYYSRKHTKNIVFGSLFYLFSIMIIIQILPVGMAIAADRYFYVSSIGLFYLAGVGFNHLYEKRVNSRIVFAIIAAVIVMWFAYLSNQRSKVWSNSLALWSSLLKTYPNIDKAHYGVGNYYYLDKEDKDYDKAIYHFKNAIRVNPGNVKAYNNLGNAYLYKQLNDSAFVYYSKLIKVDPTYVNGYHNLGNYYYNKRDFNKAIELYSKAVELNDNFAMSHYTLGLCWQYLKDEAKSNEHLIKAARLGYQDAQKILQSRNVSY